MSKSVPPFVTQLNAEQKEQLQNLLQEKNFSFSYPAHTDFQAKGTSVCCTMYSSGKLVVQGKGQEEFITFFLEPEILHSFNYSYNTSNTSSKKFSEEKDFRPRIGSDESGKGDFFGPLCIAAVYAPTKKVLEELYNSSIRDSKTVQDKSIPSLAAFIQSRCTCKVITLMPETYNRMYSRFHNLNRLLAWAHATAIHDIAPQKASSQVFAIIDQFAKNTSLLESMLKTKTPIPLIQRTKAESDIVVAAASILAREAFLKALRILEKRYQVKLLKGASPACKQLGADILLSQGKDVLEKISKTHFKTFSEIVEK